MNTAQAKRIAAEHGFEMWWERQWKAWALRPIGAMEVEASGGAYLSAGQVNSMTPQTFIDVYLKPKGAT